MSELDRCFEQGLLKRIPKNKNLALQDLQQARFFLGESSDLIRLNKPEMGAIALYNAAFHAARSLLYRDGLKEKSHYCLQKYLEEQYEKKGLLQSEDVSLFDLLRGIRQEVQYDVARVRFEEDLNELHNKTEAFIEKIQKIVEE